MKLSPFVIDLLPKNLTFSHLSAYISPPECYISPPSITRQILVILTTDLSYLVQHSFSSQLPGLPNFPSWRFQLAFHLRDNSPSPPLGHSSSSSQPDKNCMRITRYLFIPKLIAGSQGTGEGCATLLRSCGPPNPSWRIVRIPAAAAGLWSYRRVRTIDWRFRIHGPVHYSIVTMLSYKKGLRSQNESF